MSKKTYTFLILLLIASCFGVYEYASADGYVALTPITGLTTLPVGTNPGSSGTGFSGYLKMLYTWGVAGASGLAVVMIMWGGVEYMTSAGGGGVEEAKKRIQSAITGLLLALGSYLILYTVNRDLLRLDFTLSQLAPIVVKSAGAQYYNGVDTSGTSDGGNYGDYAYIDNLAGSSNGNVTLTAYGYKGDLTPDTNSSQARGNHNNLLTTGSVALSPDVISRLQPAYGAAVYVGDTKIGYYDDSTAGNYKGKQLTNRVDIFDPSGSLGGNDFSKKLSGDIRIDNSDIRSAASNPSR
ncbi:MAG: pilin [Patescibacteria group bacterium]